MAQKTQSKHQSKSTIIIGVIFALAIIAAVVTMVILNNHQQKTSVPDVKSMVRGIDCMPPMSPSEQECLDKGECYCATY